jgi:hypothetical protein
MNLHVEGYERSPRRDLQIQPVDGVESLSLLSLVADSKEPINLMRPTQLRNAQLGLPELMVEANSREHESTLLAKAPDANLTLVGELKSGGLTVRERYHDNDTGKTRDFVIARHNGIEHKFEDKPIVQIPFNSAEGIEPWRRKQIEQRGTKIIDEYAPKSLANSKGVYDFNEFGDTLTRISRMTDLTEREKAFLWDNIMKRRDTDYSTSTDGSRSWVRDSIMPWDVGHALLKGGFRDGYHVPMANLSAEAASAAIYVHELNEGTGKGFVNEFGRYVVGQVLGVKLNTGDMAASEGQVAALREYKKHGFAGYAKEWRRQFLDSEPFC